MYHLEISYIKLLEFHIVVHDRLVLCNYDFQLVLNITVNIHYLVNRVVNNSIISRIMILNKYNAKYKISHNQAITMTLIKSFCDHVLIHDNSIMMIFLLHQTIPSAPLYK